MNIVEAAKDMEIRMGRSLTADEIEILVAGFKSGLDSINVPGVAAAVAGHSLAAVVVAMRGEGIR